ncbi:MAG: radical SAM protein [Anaerolineae bacterium]|jgi:pyruvate formate-lyase activating enzyme-like uncharacterized protein
MIPRHSLPAPLKEIYETVRRSEQPPSNLDTLQETWAEHIARLREEVPDAHVEDGGEVLFLGELSAGCQACKDGTWDCIFTTMACNLNCRFCYSPHAIPRDYAGSVLGRSPEEIASRHAQTDITGVSFSGGEPFTDVEGLFTWVEWFTAHRPETYYWLYTNGLLATEAHLRRLGEMGIDEIRFNAAATGYDHPTVMANLAAAARYIPSVTVEIPAIPEDTEKLLSCLAAWSARGVRFLNLHELMYEPGTNSAEMPGARCAVVTEDGHATEINPISRSLTLSVMCTVREKELPLSVNDCSLQSKLRQIRGRRQNLAPLVKKPYEQLVAGRLYESCAAYDQNDVTLFSSEELTAMRQRYPNRRFARLARTAPLSLDDPGRWVLFEEA